MAKKKSSRETGDEFETEVAKLLRFKGTANSGAIFDDADLRPINGKPVILEAKVKNTSRTHTMVVRCEIDKVKKQADKIGKDWIYVIRDISGNRHVICDLDFFAEATEDFFSARE